MSSIATTSAVCIEDCEGWWLSGGHRVVSGGTLAAEAAGCRGPGFDLC